jgi:hypothetical protein
VKLSSPLHLHKCLSGAYTDILAVVPSRDGECRFVRVTSVLIFARAPGLCCLCVSANTRKARDICPQPDRAKTSTARLADPASGLPP